MAFYEVKRIHTDIEYFDVEASNEEEARTIGYRANDPHTELHNTSIESVSYLYDTVVEDWTPEDDSIDDEDERYFEAMHPFSD